MENTALLYYFVSDVNRNVEIKGQLDATEWFLLQNWSFAVKTILLHPACLLFPRINEDAMSNSHQVYKYKWYGNYIFYLQDTLNIWIMQVVFNFSQVVNFHVDTAIYL